MPLAVGGQKEVETINYATGMAFVNRGGLPALEAKLDPRTCLVNGYKLTLG